MNEINIKEIRSNLGVSQEQLAKLKRSDVKKGFIKVVTQKTVDGLIIELPASATDVLKLNIRAIYAVLIIFSSHAFISQNI